MKKWIIGAIVGGILTFAWQTLSWTVLDLHRNAQQYTPKQDSILQYLSSQFTESGDYFLPTTPVGASQEEMEKLMVESAGKPWAKISYHTAWDASMPANILRGLLVNIIMVGIYGLDTDEDGQSFLQHHTDQLSFCRPDRFPEFPLCLLYLVPGRGIRADLLDALLQWGLCGAWLGWWLNRK